MSQTKDREPDDYYKLAIDAILESKTFRPLPIDRLDPFVKNTAKLIADISHTYAGRFRSIDQGDILDSSHKGSVNDQNILEDVKSLRLNLDSLSVEFGIKRHASGKSFNGILGIALEALRTQLSVESVIRNRAKRRKHSRYIPITPGRTFHTNEVGPPTTLYPSLRNKPTFNK